MLLTWSASDFLLFNTSTDYASYLLIELGILSPKHLRSHSSVSKGATCCFFGGVINHNEVTLHLCIPFISLP